MASLCHPWFTTTNLSYRFPIFETSATALCGTTGKEELRVKDGCCCCGGGGGWPLLDQLGAILGAMLARLRAMLAHLGARLALLGAMWAHLGAMLAHLGAMWAQLAAHLGPSGGYGWASFRAFWGLCWAKLAHLHKSEKMGNRGGTPYGEERMPYGSATTWGLWAPGRIFWRLTPDSRAPAKQRLFGLWCGKIGPRFSAQTQGGLCWTEAGIMRSACLYGSSLGLCWAQVVPMLGQVGPMLSNFGPILGLCWAKSGPCWAIGPILGLSWPRLGLCWAHLGPMLGLCWAHVGPMWPHVEPSWELCWGHVWAMYVETILRCNFFLPGPLLEPKTT